MINKKNIIENNEVYTNGKIDVIVIKHFSRREDYIEKIVDFVFAKNIKTNDIIIRTKKEFMEEFTNKSEEKLENIVDLVFLFENL